jgi:hypothetical protein
MDLMNEEIKCYYEEFIEHLHFQFGFPFRWDYRDGKCKEKSAFTISHLK